MRSACGRTPTSSRCTSTFDPWPLAAWPRAPSRKRLGFRGRDDAVTHPNKPSAAPRGRRVLRELGAALALVVAVAVLVISQRWRDARREVAEAVADADRLDPDWRFEDMEAQRRLPPPERNSALQAL